MDNNAFLEGWGLSLMVFLPLAGALLMMLGGLVTATDRRFRRVDTPPREVAR